MQKVLEDNDEKEEIQNAEDEVEFHQIDLLKDHGINQSDVQKLIDSGFMSIEAVFYTTKKNLCLIKGLSELKVDKILNICNEILSTGFQPSNIFLEKRKKLVRITTGSKELDTLLGGGFESNSITEIFGEFRTGKTQICHTLCVTCQLPKENGGGAGKAIYIDTEGTFIPGKLIPIAERFGLEPEEVINKIIFNISIIRRI